MLVRVRLLAVLGLCGVGLLGPRDVAEAAPPDRVPEAFKSAYADLHELRRQSRNPRALNDDLLQYLTVVGHAHGEPTASGRLTAHKRERERFRKKARKLLLDCLVLTKVVRGQNRRDAVNYTAAKLLGRMGSVLDDEQRERLSRDIRRAIEQHFLKLPHQQVSNDTIEEIFLALAHLGSLASIEYILDEHMRAMERRSAFILAAHKSLLHYRNVPGTLRYRVVKQCLRTWIPIQHFSEGGSSGRIPSDGRGMMARRLWDTVRGEVIQVLQLYASSPRARAPRGRAPRMPASLSAFDAWFRRHKDVRKQPWLDLKPL